MADRIRIDFELVAQLQATLNSQARGMSDALTEFDSKMFYNDGEWSGAAHDAFIQSRRDWEQSFREKQAQLLEAARVLGEINDSFQRTEDALASSF
jgi:WXG100 family type VII secretion target